VDEVDSHGTWKMVLQMSVQSRAARFMRVDLYKTIATTTFNFTGITNSQGSVVLGGSAAFQFGASSTPGFNLGTFGAASSCSLPTASAAGWTLCQTHVASQMRFRVV